MPRPRRRRSTAVAALAAIGAGALAAPGLAAKDDLDLISRATGPAGAPVDANAIISSISANGARVAFDTDADNISAEDNNAVRNIFVRDASTNETIFASRATGATGVAADGLSRNPAISADGRYVAFQSDADNLSAEDNNAFTNVFVRDLVAGTTILVSRASGPGGAGANDNATEPDISADGRYVVFQSGADNLSPVDNNAVTNIFVRDLVADTTTLVSRAPGLAGAGADDFSFNPAISGDGNRVAFQSSANNLSAEDNDAVVNVFVRDIDSGAVAFVSRATGAAGAPADAPSFDADISPSGRYVAFSSFADNLSAEDNNAFINIFLRDLDAATTELVTRANGPGGAGADGSSFNPVVADNGRVAFDSDADNLSPDDNNAFRSVLVRDTAGDTTELVSRGPGAAGVAADQGSFLPTTTPDGRYVAFQSLATNLLPGTVPGIRNIYRRDVLGDAPLAAPVCKTVPLAPTGGGGGGAITLSSRQLLINQRIGQAAIRRLNAVEARLNGGLRARDLCGYAIGPAQLGPGIVTAQAGASLAPAAAADPAPIVDPGRRGSGDAVTLSVRQLLINQRIAQAGVREANALIRRLETGLSGEDLRPGTLTAADLG